MVSPLLVEMVVGGAGVGHGGLSHRGAGVGQTRGQVSGMHGGAGGQAGQGGQGGYQFVGLQLQGAGCN